MRTPRVELRPDHLLVKLEGPAAAFAPHRNVLIPFSDIVDARVDAPRWPTPTKQWSIATYVPGVVAVGDFHERGGNRRLLAFDRNSERTLTIKLAGHPSYDEVSVDTPDAANLAAMIARERIDSGAPWHGPAPRE